MERKQLGQAGQVLQSADWNNQPVFEKFQLIFGRESSLLRCLMCSQKWNLFLNNFNIINYEVNIAHYIPQHLESADRGCLFHFSIS